MRKFSLFYSVGSKTIQLFSSSQQKSGLLKIGTILEQNIRFTQGQNNQFNKLFNLPQDSKHISVSLVSSLFSRLIGTNIPQSIYLSQSLKILQPVKVDEQICCKVEIKQYLGKDRYRLGTTVSAKDRNIVDGQAIILYENKQNGENNLSKK